MFVCVSYFAFTFAGLDVERHIVCTTVNTQSHTMGLLATVQTSLYFPAVRTQWKLGLLLNTTLAYAVMSCGQEKRKSFVEKDWKKMCISCRLRRLGYALWACPVCMLARTENFSCAPQRGHHPHSLRHRIYSAAQSGVRPPLSFSNC